MLKSKKKTIHAIVTGNEDTSDITEVSWVEIEYKPFESEFFRRIDTGEIVTKASRLKLEGKRAYIEVKQE